MPSKAPTRPNSKVKIKKDGNIEYRQSVDHVQWKLYQLCKQALYDSAKIIRYKVIGEVKDLGVVTKAGKTPKRVGRSVKYKIGKWEDGLQIGLTHETWYGALQELGDKNQPRRAILRNTVFNNIAVIRDAQAKYLTGMNNDNDFEAVEPEQED